jgi:peptidyl-prolyl cis-trans isomerase SurA
MAAASPFRQWSLLIGLIALAGCKSDGTSAALNARGQSPAELPGPLSPVLLAPVASPQPMPQSGPMTQIQPTPSGVSPSAAAAVQGFPINTSVQRVAVQGVPSTEQISPASLVALAPDYSTSSEPVKKAASLRETGRPIGGSSTPQIKVVAMVGVSASLITDQEVMEEVRKHLGDLRRLTGIERTKMEKELYREELGRTIARELILDEMFTRLKKDNKSTDDIKEMAAQESERTLRMIQKQQGARTQQEFIDQLRDQGLTLPCLRRQIERQMMADEYIRSMLKETGRNPGFAEIRGYYDLHPDEFQVKDRVRWQDLYINISKYSDIGQARARAEQLRQMASSGTDFVSLIKAEEKSPKGRQNWDGIGTTKEDVPLDVAPAVWSLAPGQISDIVQTPTGFHIIKVLEREYAGVRPLDNEVQNKCRDKLKMMYRKADERKLIEELWRKGTVQVFEIE